MHVLPTPNTFCGWTDDNIRNVFRVRKTLEMLKIYNKRILHEYSKKMASASASASGNFFTIIKNYFKCGCCCFMNDEVNSHKGSNHDGSGGSGISGISNRGGSTSSFSFDDLSNPTTPLTSSSSSSSIEDHRIIYKRPKFKPDVGIIPSNYYSDWLIKIEFGLLLYDR